MRLVLFDIDGTLTETNELDAECFLRALDKVYGINGLDGDWEAFPHASDACIFEVIHERWRGRKPSAEEVGRFQDVFLGMMEASAASQPAAVIPGAAEVISRLADDGEHAVAFATGSWSRSARWKLALAGIALDEFPFGTADDAPAREDIMTAAIRRAEAHAGRAFSSVVYVGDAVWDARACRRLGLPLLGIGSGARAERLREHGVTHVLPDYTDHDLFLRCVATLAGESCSGIARTTADS